MIFSLNAKPPQGKALPTLEVHLAGFYEGVELPDDYIDSDDDDDDEEEVRAAVSRRVVTSQACDVT